MAAVGRQAASVLIQRETPGQAAAVRAVTAAAFTRPGQAGQSPVEADLVEWLRAGDAWLPALSLVAVVSAAVVAEAPASVAAGDAGVAGVDGEVIGHVVCSRARLAGAPVLGLGPLSVHPDHQRRGVGQALMHAVLGAADALDEPLVALLGDPGYYARFGFRAADGYGIVAPVPEWGRYFQVRTLSAYSSGLRGRFAYAEPFDRVG